MIRGITGKNSAKRLRPGPLAGVFSADEPLMYVSAQSNNAGCAHHLIADWQTLCGAGD